MDDCISKPVQIGNLYRSISAAVAVRPKASEVA